MADRKHGTDIRWAHARVASECSSISNLGAQRTDRSVRVWVGRPSDKDGRQETLLYHGHNPSTRRFIWRDERAGADWDPVASYEFPDVETARRVHEALAAALEEAE